MSPVYRAVPAFNALMAIHVALTFVMAGLGGVLIAPGDTFDTSSAWRLFIEAGAGEDKIGATMMGVALFGVVGIALPHPRIRRWSIIALAMAHASLAMAFFIGNPHGGAIVPYLALASLGLYAVSREAGSR